MILTPADIEQVRQEAIEAPNIPELSEATVDNTSIYYRFIYLLVHKFKLADCVELGAAVGRCTVHMAAANPAGRVWAIDLRPHGLYEYTTRNYSNIRLIRMGSTDPDTLAQVPDGTIALCFADSWHNPDHVLEEVQMWSRKMRDGGVFLFDDLLYKDMHRILSEIPFSQKGELPGLHYSGFGYAIKEAT